MPPYAEIPTRDDWISDCDEACARAKEPLPDEAVLERVFRQDHVLAIIVDLLDDFDAFRSFEKARADFRRHVIVMYLHEATLYWMKKGDRAPKTITGLASSSSSSSSSQSSGPVRFTRFLPTLVAPVVQALNDVAQAYLRKYYSWVQPDDVAGIREALATRGVGAASTEVEEDEKRRAEGGVAMVWLESDADRVGYKLRFRGGLVYRTDRPESGLVDPEFPLFSTRAHDTELGDGMAHFVMDRRGRIYCGYDRARARAFRFFHSSLVGGEQVLAAGLMCVEDGQVTRLSNASGHYRPEGRHMATVLQRLRLYGVDVSRIGVVDQGARQLHPAQDVLSWNGFPPKKS